MIPIRFIGLATTGLAIYILYMALNNIWAIELKILTYTCVGALIYISLAALFSKNYASFKKNLFSLSAWPF